MASIETPCTQTCSIDASSGLCRGCGRTPDEIGRWLSLSAAERRRIMDELPRRMTAPGAPRAKAASA